MQYLVEVGDLTRQPSKGHLKQSFHLNKTSKAKREATRKRARKEKDAATAKDHQDTATIEE